jgi:hypothetical protein
MKWSAGADTTFPSRPFDRAPGVRRDRAGAGEPPGERAGEMASTGAPAPATVAVAQAAGRSVGDGDRPSLVTGTNPVVRRLLAAALTVTGALALLKLLVHIVPTGAFGYEWFVDELYYLAAARHLDWGFTDYPPLFPFVTAVVTAIFGESLLAVRAVPALAGAALVLMTGALARELGGGRFAGAFAALGILAAPLYLVMHSIHTMNALDPLLWTGAAWVLLRIVKGGSPRLWILFGAVIGTGMLNKHAMAFFAAPAAIGILLTQLRRHLAQRWIWLGALTAFLIFLPNLVWVASHGFPHLEMLEFIRMHGRDVSLDPAGFLSQQALLYNPVALPLWLGGLVWLLFAGEGRRFLILGLIWLGVMALMLILDGRVYYPAPAYPMLFAAGGVAWERIFGQRRRGADAPRWIVPLRTAWIGLIAASGAIMAPLWTPLLSPEALVRWSETIGFSQPRIENHRLGRLPQLMADRFGWREMAGEVARVYHALPPGERHKAAIFGQNYGQAGAIDLYGPALGLPAAISGHLSYHSWGPREFTGEVVIVMGDSRETLEGFFEQVDKVGEVRHPWSMPYENFDIHLCRRMREPLAVIWPRLRNFG